MQQQILQCFNSGNFKTSKEIGAHLNIPDWKIRKVVNKHGLYFGHYTPFGGNLALQISDVAHQVIVGSLLGDGSISKYSSKIANSSLIIKHSVKQRAYVRYKRYLLKNEGIGEGYYALQYRVDDRNSRLYGFSNYQSTNNTSFNAYRDKWYGTGKKVVPRDIEITPLVLAIWYMDDGTKAGTSGYYLCTDSFGIDEQVILQESLLRLGIKTALHKISNTYRIYINRESVPQFNNIVTPYMHKTMQYKILSI